MNAFLTQQIVTVNMQQAAILHGDLRSRVQVTADGHLPPSARPCRQVRFRLGSIMCGVARTRGLVGEGCSYSLGRASLPGASTRTKFWLLRSNGIQHLSELTSFQSPPGCLTRLACSQRADSAIQSIQSIQLIHTIGIQLNNPIGIQLGYN
eukprot:SAG31_NODE_3179_length_4583_cov_1.884478_3_plen_151_part_00